MRYELEKILGEELRYLAIETRERLHITQREMGELLQMSESSYSDIETGRSSCGVLTEILLLHIQDDPRIVLQKISARFQAYYSKEPQPI